MKIAIACDHRGFEAKKKLLPVLKKLGHEVQDFGCDTAASCDYVDLAAPAARAVARGEAEVGILLEGSGIGMSITANKVRGIRAALVHDEVTARRAREHHHCNVLCIGTELLSEDHIKSIMEIFLSATFQDGRHSQRVAKVMEIENQQ
ncbi:MAG: ribose 5-phosphate isomerase [Phycisphaerales bacterium]|jgi:ribose 5-phosphate isomerase B|nr:ribose 5-phosphate isomerase [Phycisphaerales bacterium]